MHSNEVKQRVIDMRLQGQSYNEIGHIVGLPGTTIASWCRKVVLSEAAKQRLRQRQSDGWLKRHAADHSKRKAATKLRHAEWQEEGYRRASGDDGFRVLCALYWGEGAKAGSQNSFIICNCDPLMLKIVFGWLVSEGFEHRITFSVNHHDDVSKQDVTNWWLTQLPGLTTQHLRSFTVKPAQSGPGRWVYGTARMSVHDTRLRQQVMGGIRYIIQDMEARFCPLC